MGETRKHFLAQQKKKSFDCLCIEVLPDIDKCETQRSVLIISKTKTTLYSFCFIVNSKCFRKREKTILFFCQHQCNNISHPLLPCAAWECCIAGYTLWHWTCLCRALCCAVLTTENKG